MDDRPVGALLVTGASGKFGTALLTGLDALRERFTEIRLLVRRDAAVAPHRDVVFARGNLDDRLSLDRAAQGVHTVLHLAALTHSHDAASYDSVNREGTERLLAACTAHGVAKFVFMSSRAAQADAGAYGRSKLAAERAVEASGLASLTLCPAEAYGAGSGDAVSSLIGWIRKGRPVPLPGRGESLLAPVDARDVLAATRVALGRTELRGRFLLAGPEEMTYRQLVQRVGRALDKRPWPVPVPWWILRSGALVSRLVGSNALVADQLERLRATKPADSSAARRELDFAPRPLEAGLADLLRLSVSGDR